MEYFDSYKNVKGDKKKGDGRLDVAINGLLCKNTFLHRHICSTNVNDERVETLRLQTKETPHPFLEKPFFFYPDRNAFYLKSQKRKRRFASFISDKKDHTLILSKSFVNLIMVDGKKSKAEKIFSQTLKKLAEYLQNDVKRKGHKKKEITIFDKKESGSLLIVSDKVEKRNVYQLLQKAIDNVKPTLQVRKVRIARSIYQVPFIMKKKRQEKSGVRWIIESAKKKSRHSRATFSECLAQAVLEALTAQGQAREKRDQLHRTAEANRAYLRYRWW